MRTLVRSLRCTLVALLALTIVSARPAMLLAHAGNGMEHGCAMSMRMQQGAPHSHTDHHCSSSETSPCCDECLCACTIGSGGGNSVVALTATYTHPIAVASRFSEVVRERKAIALRLPPPIGPPLLTRS